MKYSDNAMCAILLCSHICLKDNSELKPLTLKEWGGFLDLMDAAGVEPGTVLAHDFNGEQCFEAFPGMWGRVSGLLARGGSIAMELDDLEKAGISVVTTFDAGYPVLLKRRLKKKSPPLFYYAGNLELAGKIGIGVAGSRNMDQYGAEFVQKLVEKASGERLVIYSGGARGADTISEHAAINNGGAAVSYIADSLLSRIRQKDNLNALMNGKLLLLSDMNPDMGFTVARAMNRNKYIYTSSFGTFVVSSDYEKGGTWAGATEAIKNGWTKVFVWNHAGYAGNAGLIEKGGIPYELSDERIVDTLSKYKIQKRQGGDGTDYEQISLFSKRA